MNNQFTITKVKMKTAFQLKTIMFIALSMISLSLSAQKIGFLLDGYLTDRWYLDQKLFTNRITELGGEPLVETANGDTLEQLRLGKKLIAAGVKVLAIVPTDAKQAAKIVALAKAANIPVVAYDRLILSNDLSLYVSYNNEKVGSLQAEYALNHMPKGNYVLLNGPVSDNNAMQFSRGQRKILEPHIKSGKIKIIGDFVMNDWGELSAMMKIDEFITSSKDKLNVIIAANDALASGAIQSLPKELLGKVIITGQDADLTAIKSIISGEQSMTVYKPIKPLAQMAAEMAMKLAKGELIKNTSILQSGGVSVKAILLDPIVVDKLNYKDTVVKDGHVSLSQIINK